MSRLLTFASAAVAVVVETAAVWLLARYLPLDLSVAFALAFAAGYLALFAAINFLSPSGANPSLGAQLRTYSLFGLAALLVVEAMVYLCDGLLHAGPATTNAAVLVAVACWIAAGWRFVRFGARRPQ
jgi:hypothetical protein